VFVVSLSLVVRKRAGTTNESTGKYTSSTSMRRALFVAACAVLLLFIAVSAHAEEQQVDLSDPEITSFLEDQSHSDAVFSAELDAEVGDSLDVDRPRIKPAIIKRRPKKRTRNEGGRVLNGGPPRKWKPNMSKGTADGSKLPPYDPFRLRRRWKRKDDARNQKRQAKADAQNRLETCRAMRARARRRERLERLAREEEKRLAAEEAQKNAAKTDGGVETDLVEVGSALNADVDAFAAEEAGLDAEMFADEQEAAQAEVEELTDAEESDQDLNEMEADVLDGAEVDVDIESEGETDVDSSAEEIPDAYQQQQSLLEHDSVAETEGAGAVEHEDAAAGTVLRPSRRLARKLARRKRKGKKKLLPVLPSKRVTFGREDLVNEGYDNSGGRAVFHRRERGQEIVRFEKRLSSTPGQAVVKGVTKMPCGKEITDQGLFQPVVKRNLSPTVEAANPQPPRWTDDNIHAVYRLPVVPQIREAAAPDEYGDMPS